MPRYRYTIADDSGGRTSGEVDGPTPEAVLADLQGRGLIVESVVPIEPEQTPGIRDRLSGDETRQLARHIAEAVTANIPLPSTLRALAEEWPPGPLRRALGALASRLEGGESIDEALEAEHRRLPPHLRGLILAGSKGGNVGQVLSEFVNYTQVGASLRRSLWVGLAYPTLILVAFWLLFFGISYWLVAQFESIFSDFGVNLPIITMQLIQLSHAVNRGGFFVLYAPFVAIVAVWLAARVLLDAPSRHRLIASIPLFGPLWRWTALAEFSHFLGLLLENRVALDAAIPLAAEGSRDADLAVLGRYVAEEVRAGGSLRETVGWWRVYPETFTKLLDWAQGSQTLPETLHMIAAIFEARARTQAAFVGTACGVAAIIFILWGCVFLVVGLFLPLIQLISKLSG